MSIILDKINYSYSEGTAYQIQALKNVNLEIKDDKCVQEVLNFLHTFSAVRCKLNRDSRFLWRCHLQAPLSHFYTHSAHVPCV